MLFLKMFSFIWFLSIFCFATEDQKLLKENTNVNKSLEMIANFSLHLANIDTLPDRDIGRLFKEKDDEYSYEKSGENVTFEDYKKIKNEEYEEAKRRALNDIEENKELIDSLYLLFSNDLKIESEFLGEHEAVILTSKNIPVKNIIYYVHGGPCFTITNPKELSVLAKNIINNYDILSEKSFRWGVPLNLKDQVFDLNRVFHVLPIALELSKLGYAFVCLNFPYFPYKGSNVDENYEKTSQYLKIKETKKEYSIGQHLMPYIKEQLDLAIPHFNGKFNINQNMKNIYWGHSFGGELGHRLIKDFPQFMEENFQNIILAMPATSWEWGKWGGLDENSVMAKNNLKVLKKFNVPVWFIGAKKDDNVPFQEVLRQYEAFKKGQDLSQNGDICSFVFVDGYHGVYSPLSITQSFLKSLKGELFDVHKLSYDDFTLIQDSVFLDKHMMFGHFDIIQQWFLMRLLTLANGALNELGHDNEEKKEIASDLLLMKYYEGDYEPQYITEMEGKFKSFLDVYLEQILNAHQEMMNQYMLYDRFVGVIKNILEDVPSMDDSTLKTKDQGRE